MPQTENQTDWEKTVEWVGIVAGCVVKKDGKYLLVQEKQTKVYGLWNLPAGHVDKGETIEQEQAAIREVKEETGYDVALGEQIGIYHERPGTPVKHIFSAEINGGELKIQEDEILDVKWLSLEEVKVLKETDKLRTSWIWDVITRVEHANHEKEDRSELSARLAEAAKQVTIGARYMHYKQLSYKVVGIALREEDYEPCVIYQAEYGDKVTWIRPVSSWVEEVEVSGKKVKRFTKVSES
jgi:8-oxo-dGTP diphosphatase